MHTSNRSRIQKSAGLGPPRRFRGTNDGSAGCLPRPPFVRWFPGGVLNTCYNAVDRHVERGRGKQAALIYDSPVTKTVRTFTYADLREHVALVAGSLRDQGVAKGDRVIIY